MITRVILRGIGAVCPECLSRGHIPAVRLSPAEVYSFGVTDPPARLDWDVDAARKLIAHAHASQCEWTPNGSDAGSQRDQLAPFCRPTAALSYIGWCQTRQIGTGLGLAAGAKLLVKPDKLCINVWGDATIGFTGMDFETAMRERIPILSLPFNNCELKVMAVATEKYRTADILGKYAHTTCAFGAHGERVTDPDQIVRAIQRGIQQTRGGCPALLDFITQKETQTSEY